MSETLVLIQARFGSTRLPGKIAMDIAGESMLGRVLKRVRACGLPYYVAFPRPEEDENDVVSRFVRVASHLDGVGIFGRITADCPLLDVGVVGCTFNVFRRHAGLDFAGTHPDMDGTDFEVFTRDALYACHLGARGAEREHVTGWMRQNLRAEIVNMAPQPMRWSVDDAEGLAFARAVYAACPHCAAAVPHHTNASGSIGGGDRRLCVDLHDLGQGGLAECTAADLKMARMGEAWRYASAR